MIYRHLTDSDRLLVLLALNAAMAQAALTSLRWDAVEEGAIKRVRHKSGVYSGFALWTETQQGLAWWRKVLDEHVGIRISCALRVGRHMVALVHAAVKIADLLIRPARCLALGGQCAKLLVLV